MPVVARNNYSAVLLFLDDELLPPALNDERFDDEALREDDEPFGVVMGSRLLSGTRSSTNFSSSRNVLASIESITMSSSSGELWRKKRIRPTSAVC